MWILKIELKSMYLQSKHSIGGFIHSVQVNIFLSLLLFVLFLFSLTYHIRKSKFD